LISERAVPGCPSLQPLRATAGVAMLCQDCPKQKNGTCTELCEKAEKFVNKGYRSQFELNVGREPEYDDSSIWPDDPETELDPGLLARQTRGTGKAKIDRVWRSTAHAEQVEDDHEHSTGPGLKGRHVASPAVTSWTDMASYYSEKSAKFECLTPLQNKCLHLFHFEGLTLAEIAQRVRKRKTAVKGQLQRARAKLRSEFSEGKEGNKLDEEKVKKAFPQNGANSTQPID
jgi:hypothetical protein